MSCQQATPKSGYTPLAGAGSHGLRLIEFGVLRLDAGETYAAATGERETGLVVIAGTGDVRVGDRVFRRVGRRAGFFAGKASGVYAPPRVDYGVRAETAMEIAVASVAATTGGEPTVVRPSQVTTRVMGRGRGRRRVDFVLFEHAPTTHLVMGETRFSPGGWSGWPPHRHDRDNPPVETRHDEVYLFKFEPAQGFGFVRVYDDAGLNETYTVNDNDYVAIPRGYHTIAGAPGYKAGYVWVMAGETPGWTATLDPRHAGDGG